MNMHSGKFTKQPHICCFVVRPITKHKSYILKILSIPFCSEGKTQHHMPIEILKIAWYNKVETQ